jgi:AraC-like DNA-binding protein
VSIGAAQQRLHTRLPKDYLLSVQVYLRRLMGNVILLLLQGSLSDIALEYGFVNRSHLNLHFTKLTGISPKKYRARLMR